MHSIRPLFEISDEFKSKIPKKYKKRISRKCDHLKGSKKLLPTIKFPDIGTREHSEDIENVKFYYTNPSLDENFLMSSDRSVESCFKLFCEEVGIKPDWSVIADILDDVDSIVLKLKFEHNRPRPKYYLQHEGLPYHSIKDCKSPSFPSGHTTIAYFLSEILSSAYSELRQDFEMMAELVGQSRMENGVHYPSDISAGKMIGQMLGDLYVNNPNKKEYRFDRLKKSDFRNFANFLIKKFDSHETGIQDLANYLHLSNIKENYHVPYGECVNASKKIFSGYPLDYITDSMRLKSVIAPLVYSHKISDIDSPFKIVALHNQMFPNSLERGIPGEFRNFQHQSPTGHAYVDKDDIYFELLHFCEIRKDDPFLRHAYFEHVHPFSDGNGRIGRVILCKDMNYDFKSVNNLISEDYIDKLNLYFEFIMQ